MNLTELLLNWQWILFIVFCIIAAIQVFYYLFFFSRLAFHKKSNNEKNPFHSVSVIICARDEAENLSRNLPGSLVQDYPATHEIIVVNDNSYDESKYVLEEFQRTYGKLRPIELTQEAKMIPGKKFPLSIGIKSAKHEIVLLTDADCVPGTEHWINSMQKYFQGKTEIVLGYGAYHKKNIFLNKIIRWETFHSALQYLSYALAGVPYMGVGRNLSYKKDVFFRHKGFSSHHNIPGGDDDLFINMSANSRNTTINLEKESFTLSKAAVSWKQWMAQKKRHYTTAKYYRPLHKFLLGQYSLTLFLFYPLFIFALFYNWQIALSLFSLRLIIQGIVFYKSMNKLEEKDLFPLFIFYDMGMFLYYLVFATSIFIKPKPTWK